MNKKQLIVAWAMGILMAVAFMLSPHSIWYGSKHHGCYGCREVLDPPALHIDSVPLKAMPYHILMNLIKSIPPLLIIGILLTYTLRDKKK